MNGPARIVRFAGRLASIGALATVAALVAAQFESIVAKNIALAHELSASRAGVQALRERTVRQGATIRRLADPQGAVPEIHEKLRLVGPHEEIIFLRGPGRPSPRPDDPSAGR